MKFWFSSYKNFTTQTGRFVWEAQHKNNTESRNLDPRENFLAGTSEELSSLAGGIENMAQADDKAQIQKLAEWSGLPVTEKLSIIKTANQAGSQIWDSLGNNFSSADITQFTVDKPQDAFRFFCDAQGELSPALIEAAGISVYDDLILNFNPVPSDLVIPVLNYALPSNNGLNPDLVQQGLTVNDLLAAMPEIPVEPKIENRILSYLTANGQNQLGSETVHRIVKKLNSSTVLSFLVSNPEGAKMLFTDASSPTDHFFTFSFPENTPYAARFTLPDFYTNLARGTVVDTGNGKKAYFDGIDFRVFEDERWFTDVGLRTAADKGERVTIGNNTSVKLADYKLTSAQIIAHREEAVANAKSVLADLSANEDSDRITALQQIVTGHERLALQKTLTQRTNLTIGRDAKFLVENVLNQLPKEQSDQLQVIKQNFAQTIDDVSPALKSAKYLQAIQQAELNFLAEAQLVLKSDINLSEVSDIIVAERGLAAQRRSTLLHQAKVKSFTDLGLKPRNAEKILNALNRVKHLANTSPEKFKFMVAGILRTFGVKKEDSKAFIETMIEADTPIADTSMDAMQTANEYSTKITKPTLSAAGVAQIPLSEVLGSENPKALLMSEAAGQEDPEVAVRIKLAAELLPTNESKAQVFEAFEERTTKRVEYHETVIAPLTNSPEVANSFADEVMAMASNPKMAQALPDISNEQAFNNWLKLQSEPAFNKAEPAQQEQLLSSVNNVPDGTNFVGFTPTGQFLLELPGNESQFVQNPVTKLVLAEKFVGLPDSNHLLTKNLALAQIYDASTKGNVTAGLSRLVTQSAEQGGSQAMSNLVSETLNGAYQNTNQLLTPNQCFQWEQLGQRMQECDIGLDEVFARLGAGRNLHGNVDASKPIETAKLVKLLETAVAENSKDFRAILHLEDPDTESLFA